MLAGKAFHSLDVRIRNEEPNWNFRIEVFYFAAKNMKNWISASGFRRGKHCFHSAYSRMHKITLLKFYLRNRKYVLRLEVGADQKLAGGGAPGGSGRRGGGTPRRGSFKKKNIFCLSH